MDGKLSTYKQPCGRANGLCFDQDGNLWACADEKNELWCIRPDGTAQVVVKDYEGKLLNGPNDLWVRPDGGLYFTDPFYQRDYWQRGPAEQPVEGVYYLTPDRQKLTRVIDDLQQPNGIIGSPAARPSMWRHPGGKDLCLRHPGEGALATNARSVKLGSTP